MSQEEFENFRRIVLDDPALQSVLREASNRASFVALAIRLAAERGCELTPQEVEDALRASRRELLERWV
ncbi:MAG: Nif11-like leader peptide family natural product precursor [Pyrinomonadaceae bacterium]